MSLYPSKSLVLFSGYSGSLGKLGAPFWDPPLCWESVGCLVQFTEEEKWPWKLPSHITFSISEIPQSSFLGWIQFLPLWSNSVFTQGCISEQASWQDLGRLTTWPSSCPDAGAPGTGGVAVKCLFLDSYEPLPKTLYKKSIWLSFRGFSSSLPNISLLICS